MESTLPRRSPRTASKSPAPVREKSTSRSSAHNEITSSMSSSTRAAKETTPVVSSPTEEPSKPKLKTPNPAKKTDATEEKPAQSKKSSSLAKSASGKESSNTVKRRRSDRSSANDSEDEDESGKEDNSTTVKRVKAETEKEVVESAKAERKRMATEQLDETTEESEDEEEKEPTKAAAKRIRRTSGDEEGSDVGEEESDEEGDLESDDLESSGVEHSHALGAPTSFHSGQDSVDGPVISESKTAPVATERPDLAMLKTTLIDEKEYLSEKNCASSPSKCQMENRPKISSLAELEADKKKQKQRGEDLLQAFDETDSSVDSKLTANQRVISTTS